MLIIFQFFNLKKPIKIETNILNLIIGACLLQPKNNNKWHPITY